MESAPQSSSDRHGVVRPKRHPKRQRSRITNGTALLPGVDGRGPWVRRCKDVIAAHLSDIPDASAAESSIIRRASVLTVELERLEAKFAVAGEANTNDLDLYQRTASTLRRLLEAVGLQRRAKDAGDLTLSDLLRADEEEQRREEAAARAARIDEAAGGTHVPAEAENSPATPPRAQEMASGEER
jgi:hypothetical protein